MTHQEMILPNPYGRPKPLSRLITAAIANREYDFALRLLDRLATMLRDRLVLS